MLDVEALLRPLDGAPCGPDLRGEPEFRDIEDAPGGFANLKAPELRKTVAACAAFLARTKDQMPALVALQAAVRIGDLSETAAALQLIKGYAQEFWDDFHPGPAEEMLIGRINELSALTRPAAMVLPLQRLAIARMPAPSTIEFTHAQITQACEPTAEWSDADETRVKALIEQGQMSAAAARNVKPARDGGRMLRLIVRQLNDDARRADTEAGVTGDDAGDRELAIGLRSQVADAREKLGVVSDLFYEIVEIYQGKGGDSPGFGPVLTQLNAMKADCDKFLEIFADPAAEAAVEAGNEPAAGEAAAGGGAAAPKAFVAGVPRNRDDVMLALDNIAKYFEQNEPTSPVPLMLRRVRSWVHKDFMQLAEEIASGGIDELRKLLAITRE